MELLQRATVATPKKIWKNFPFRESVGTVFFGFALQKMALTSLLALTNLSGNI